MKFLPSFLRKVRPEICDPVTRILYLKNSARAIQRVSAATLREAQTHPEQYRHLVVRVAGYSAYFTELDQELQNEIIRRTEFESV